MIGRLPLTTMVLVFAAAQSTAQLIDDPRTVSHVKVYASLSKQTFRNGETGELRLTIAPEEGYHVNANPPVELVIDSGKVVQLKGELSQAVDRSNGTLSTRSPLRQTFYVPSTVTPGAHIIKATVTYYYCSDIEGWCVKFRQPVSFSFTVSR